MKALKLVGIALVVLVILVAVAVLIQPSEGHIEKSIVINAPVHTVFKEVNSFQNFNEWSPWAAMDPSATYTYEGPDRGVGAKMNWEGEKVGQGSQWIVESISNERVKNGLSFQDYDSEYTATYLLASEDGGTRITWSYDGPNNGFTGKMMWLIMKGMLEEQYESGLTSLKAMIEAQSHIPENY